MWLDGLPIRGGNWNNGVNAGVFALNLNNARSNTSTNIGFRPALGESQKLGPHGVPSSAPSKGPAILGQVPKNTTGRGGTVAAAMAATPRSGRPFHPVDG